MYCGVANLGGAGSGTGRGWIDIAIIGSSNGYVEKEKNTGDFHHGAEDSIDYLEYKYNKPVKDR
jgi:hypothetical protein